MADIIYAQPQAKSGLGISLGDILPIAALGVLALGAYWLFKNMNAVNGTSSQGTNTGPQLGPATGNGGTGAGTDVVNQAQGTQSYADTLANLIKQQASNLAAASVKQQASNLAAASKKPVTVTQTPTGTPVINVNAGKDTPTNFFPAGNNVISYSQQPTQSMIQETVQNLVSGQATQNIRNAWWQTPTITQTTQPGGVNSGGSYQSNIPVGTKHCPCTAALKASGVCGPNDDWYYC